MRLHIATAVSLLAAACAAQTVFAIPTRFDPATTGHGVGAPPTQEPQCGLYRYEISHDGGVAWDPYLDPSWICEEASASSHAPSDRPAPVPTRVHQVRLFGRGLLDDAGLAYVTRSRTGTEPLNVEVDTVNTTPEYLEAALLGLGALADAKVTDARATHVRLKVGRG